MRRIPLLMLILCAACVPAFSQGEIPVDMYTGTPSITIPIWNVTTGSLSEPISLSYNANSVRQKSSVGPGWSVSAGGSVSREVRSFPDDETGTVKGWMYVASGTKTAATIIDEFTPTADTVAGTSRSDEASDYTTISGFNYAMDTEPDVFYYNAGGISGSFVIGPDLKAHTIPYQDVTIVLDYPNLETPSNPDRQLTGFTITTNQGYIYNFYTQVTATRKSFLPSILNGTPTAYAMTEYDLYKTQVTYTREWKLTSIYAPDGSHIDFSYVPFSGSHASSTLERQLGAYQYPDPIYPTHPQTLRVDIQYTTHYYVSTTTSDIIPWIVAGSTGSKVEFMYSGEILKNINISDTRRGSTSAEQLVKTFLLEYLSVSDVLDASSQANTTQFLKSVTEFSGCDRLPPYRFEYKGIEYKDLNVPTAGLYWSPVRGVDLWGTPNGTVQERSIPKIYIYPEKPTWADRYGSFKLGNAGTEYILTGADMGVSDSHMKLGTLLSMTSPEGGTTSFDFEAHTYAGDGFQNMPAGGLRIRSITYFDGFNPIPVKKTFEYEQGKLIRKPIYAMPTYAWKNGSGVAYNLTNSSALTDEEKWKYPSLRTSFNLSPSETTHGSVVGYKKVTVKRPGAGYSVHEFYVPGAYGQLTDGQWKAVPVRIARPNTTPLMTLGNFSVAGQWAFPHIPSPDYDYQRGLPWRTTDFNEAGQMVSRSVTTYQDIYKTGTAPLKIGALKYERFPGTAGANRIFMFGKYDVPTEAQRVPKKVVNTIYEPSTGTYLKDSIEYLYESPNHKYLSKVKRYASDGKIYTSYMRYAKDFASSSSGNDDAVAIHYMNIYDHEGILIESYNTLKNATDSAEYVIGGSAAKFSAMGYSADRHLLRSRWQLKANPPFLLSSFNPSAVVIASGNGKFKLDSRYERTDSVQVYSSIPFKPKVTRNPVSRQNTVVGYGYSSSLPVVQLTNVQLSNPTDLQAAFSDFETTTGFEFTEASSYYGTGRTGSRAFYAKYALSKNVTRAPAVSNYILSFWIKSDQTFALKVSLQTTGGTEYSYVNVTVPNTSSVYKYVQAVIPLTGVPAAPGQFKVVLQAASLPAPSVGNPYPGQLSTSLVNIIDDVFFYPENADMVSTTYTIPFGAASVTTAGGSTSYQEYDKLGRPRYTYDRDRNIVRRTSYNYPVATPLFSDFSISEFGSISINTAVTFTAAANPCVSETITYEWDWGTGTFTSGTAIQSHTFTATGSYVVRLRVTSASYGSKTSTKTFNVVYPPLDAEICAKGVHEFVGTSVATQYSCTAITASPPTSSGVIFRVTPQNALSGETFTYVWQITDLASINWVNIGSDSNQYTYSKVLPTTKSFVMRCVVTSNLGRTKTTTAMEVIVTP